MLFTDKHCGYLILLATKVYMGVVQATDIHFVR